MDEMRQAAKNGAGLQERGNARASAWSTKSRARRLANLFFKFF